MYKKIIQSHKKGFTLLEMIVSMGIFSFVAVIAVGSLVRITGLNRQAQSLQSAMNNINFALESMSREMRFGTNYYCGTDNSFSAGALSNLSFTGCSSKIDDGTVIAFKSSKPGIGNVYPRCQLVIAYWFSGSTIKKDQQTDCDDRIGLDEAGEITDSTNVSINNHTISIFHGNKDYSFASIRIIGYSGTKAKESTNFDIQTAVAQRIAD